MKLREWRLMNKVTLADLGEAVGVSKGHLSFFESGKKKLSADLAKKIEAFTRGQVTAASLLGLREAPRRARDMREETAAFQAKEALTVEVTLPAAQRKELQTLGIDVETVAREGARRAITEAHAAAWRDANREAIDAYNKWIAEHGALAEQFGLI